MVEKYGTDGHRWQMAKLAERVRKIADEIEQLPEGVIIELSISREPKETYGEELSYRTFKPGPITIYEIKIDRTGRS